MTRMLLAGAVALGFCGLAGWGCRSTENPANPAGAQFAAVEIHGNTPGQISAMTKEVFEKHGFKTTETRIDRLVFEKPGSKMDNFAYGSWMSDNPVWLRIKVAIVPIAEAACRLQCNAYLVQDKGRALEEEDRMKHLHSGEYQKLLEEVAQRLNPNAPGKP